MNSLKTLVIGLDGATPELLFEDEGLMNIRRLMEAGSYGPLEGVVPPTRTPSWFCLGAGQDPGSLGIYGSGNRADRSYRPLSTLDTRSIPQVFTWDHVVRAGGKAVIHGILSPYIPSQFRGLDPPKVTAQALASEAKRTELWDAIVATTHKRFAVVRDLLEHEEWNYLQFIETGMDVIQRAFWRYHDPAHRLHEAESPHRNLIREYYRLIDEEVGRLLEVLSDQTVVLVVSTRGAQWCHGGFCLNQWLIREGLLVLRQSPSGITSFDSLDVDRSQTRAWAEGWDCAQLHLNLQGREPEGTIDSSEYDAFRAELKARVEAITDQEGRPLGNLVFEPDQIYKTVRNVPPDLLVELGGMSWRVVDAVGFSSLFLSPEEINGESSSPGPQGAFVLAIPGAAGLGPVTGTSLLDIAPTLLELGGHELSAELQGHSLLSRRAQDPSTCAGDVDADEQLLRDRLQGLGYLG
jgi:predicted AlkP superfamily phosphohydrolase/phosphomutase